ncbi:hypothetical protein PM082_023544 [Marasmius tenuissimus]|nr:hypothetical protein PM082_023544 [Marasmius tenuissimus]
MSNIDLLHDVNCLALGYGATSGSALGSCCRDHSMERAATRPRNLVVCIDGTSKKFGRNNSNVVELYSRLVKDDSQLTYYNSGIGTHAKPSLRAISYYMKKAGDLVDMAFAWWFEKRIMEAYRWLSENYREGDRIFLFGFSRGAYQVRVLSAMIHKVGLIQRGNDAQMPFAYELYSKCTDLQALGCVNRKHSEIEKDAERFKSTFGRNVKVHFVGAWDTVSSVGFCSSDILPSTTTGMAHVCYFRHALALDETRVKFLPEYAGGENEIEARDEYPTPKKEVWFAGTHSDIGGGGMANSELMSNGPALRWMIKESIEAGLSLKPFSGKWGTVYGKLSIVEQHPPSKLWSFLEVVPWLSRTLVPHFGQRRDILPGQRIHQSVYSSNPRYVAQRLPETLKNSDGNHVERDEFDDVASDIDNCVSGEGRWSNLPDADKKSQLQELASSKTGHLAFQDLYESLKLVPLVDPELADERTAIIAKMEILCSVASHLPKGHIEDVPEVVKVFLRRDPKDRAAREFIEKFSHAQIFKIHLEACVNSLVLSKGGPKIDGDGEKAERRSYYLAVASAQSTIPVYNLSTGHIIRSLRGHTKDVKSLSFSPDSDFDKLILVSGSGDGTIRTWDVARNSQWRSANEGHIDGTSSVSFSSDGVHVFSGGRDGCARMWKVDRENHKLKLYSSTEEEYGMDVLSATGCSNTTRLVSIFKDDKTQLIHLYSREGASSPFSLKSTIERGPHDPKEVILLSEDEFLSASAKGILKVTNAATGLSEDYSLRASPTAMSKVTNTVTGFSETRDTDGIPQGVTVCSLGFCHPDQLACGLSDGRIMVWAASQQARGNRTPGTLDSSEQRWWLFRELYTYDYHLEGKAPSPVTSIAYSDDRQRLVAGYADGHVVVWYAQGMKGVFDHVSPTGPNDEDNVDKVVPACK